MTPTRIQRKREKGWKAPEGTISVTRPGKWGNEFRFRPLPGGWWAVFCEKRGYFNGFFATERLAAEHAVEMFEKHQLPGMDVSELFGKNIMCFCVLDMPCHGDSILEKANGR
jgi:hypothetical protein